MKNIKRKFRIFCDTEITSEIDYSFKTLKDSDIGFVRNRMELLKNTMQNNVVELTDS